MGAVYASMAVLILSPKHGNWAFQYPRSKDFWGGKIPEDTDILITHGPPRAHLDLLSLGCVYLLQELWCVHPRLHVFGHVHEGAGTEWLQFDALQDMYERVVVSGGGLWNLFWLMWSFVRVFFFCRPAEARCLLVNPAVVGGLRDDEARRLILTCMSYTNNTCGSSTIIFISKNLLL